MIGKRWGKVPLRWGKARKLSHLKFWITPLGYRSVKRQLVVEEAEAELVRRIFTLYRDLGSIGLVVERLDADGRRTRRGFRFGPGPIAAMLKNRFYLGEVVWQGQVHKGEHAAIVDRELFEAGGASDLKLSHRAP